MSITCLNYSIQVYIRHIGRSEQVHRNSRIQQVCRNGRTQQVCDELTWIQNVLYISKQTQWVFYKLIILLFVSQALKGVVIIIISSAFTTFKCVLVVTINISEFYEQRVITHLSNFPCCCCLNKSAYRTVDIHLWMQVLEITKISNDCFRCQWKPNSSTQRVVTRDFNSLCCDGNSRNSRGYHNSMYNDKEQNVRYRLWLLTCI